MKRIKIRGIHVVVVVWALLILTMAILQCQRKIRAELQIQMQENVRDVATQNAVTLEEEIVDKQNLLKSMAGELKYYTDGNPEEILDVLKPFTDIYKFKRIGFCYPNGNTYTTDGFAADLSFREFFKEGMKGKSYITATMLDTIGRKEQINVFSEPVYDQKNKKVAGVIFATYQTEKFQELISIDSFGGEGYSYLVQSDGAIVAEPVQSELGIRKNILSYINTADSANRKTVRKIRKDMLTEKSGYASFRVKGEKYAYYAPVHCTFEEKPCYMLTVVSAKVLTKRISPVLQYINTLLIIIAVVIGTMILGYLYSYRRGRMQLWRLAYQDALTGDDNYPSFELKMQEKGDVSGFLVSMDLSEFKIVNSTCGVEKGDETLRSVWRVIRETIQVTELAARINADHFVLFLEEDKVENMVARLEQITNRIVRLSEELNIPRMYPYFGIYEIKGQIDVEVAYGCANEAKHLVKGRHDTNYAFYDEVDFKQLMGNKELEERFEGAICNHEFEIWYQPKYSADNAHIVGAEALTRWRDSDGSLIPPYRFIPLFEKNGMIAMLDEYVFRAVCAQQKQWEQEGKTLLPISVNISRVSLYYSNIVEKYKKILDEYQLEARVVPLEITESATVDNMEIRGLIDQFHAAGFPLLLDDFGNGYSSLATLNVMHFDILKLDKSLIDYIGDEKGEKLLYYTIKLAKSLGMQITAEGVEYKEQVEFLQNLKCNDIQGFFFSKPLPLEEFQKRICE